MFFRVFVMSFFLFFSVSFSILFAQTEPKQNISQELYESVIQGIERAIIKEKIGFFMTGVISGIASFNGLKAVSAFFKMPVGANGNNALPWGGFPNAQHGYTLGNYPSSVAAFGFGYKKLFGDQKQFFLSSYTQMGISYSIPYGSPIVYSYPGVTPYLQDAWVSLGETQGVQAWGGMRAYKSQGSPIAGTLRRLRGIGLGVENIQFKKENPINLDIALITRADGVSYLASDIKNKAHQTPDSGGLFTEFHLDFRLEEIFVGKAGKLSFQVTPVLTSGGSIMSSIPPAAPAAKELVDLPPQLGIQFALSYEGKHVMGYDKTGSLSGLLVQFGYGSGVNFDPSTPNGFLLKQIPSQYQDAHVRSTYYALINCLPWLDVGINTGIGWLQSQSGIPFKTGYSVYGSGGTRPIFYIKENFFIATEYNFDFGYQPAHILSSDKTEEPKLFAGIENSFQILQKFTLAPGIKIPGRFFANPLISAFVTLAFWNQDSVPMFHKTPWKERLYAVTWGLQVKAVF